MPVLLLHFCVVGTFRYWLRGHWLARLAVFQYLAIVAVFAMWNVNVNDDLGEHRAIPLTLVVVWIISGLPGYWRRRQAAMASVD